MDQYYYTTFDQLNKRKMWIIYAKWAKMTRQKRMCTQWCITVDIQIGQCPLFRFYRIYARYVSKILIINWKELFSQISDP